MTCQRCNGLEVEDETYYDICIVKQLRCLNCGNVRDRDLSPPATRTLEVRDHNVMHSVRLYK